MFRATTPVHNFIFDDDPNDFTVILITYAQKNRIIFEKNKEDLTIEPYITSTGSTKYVASVKLTQQETKMFHTYNAPVVHVQVRALDAENNAYASEKFMLSLKDVFNDQVLTYTEPEP